VVAASAELEIGWLPILCANRAMHAFSPDPGYFEADASLRRSRCLDRRSIDGDVTHWAIRTRSDPHMLRWSRQR